MTELRAAVIGVGYLGFYHAQKYHGLPGVNLTTVVDIDNARAHAIARQYSATAYTSHLQILDQIDLASIAVPTEYHYQIAADCLNAGIHILVEKPITQTLCDAQKLIDLAQARQLVFQVGHLERFNPATLAIQTVLDNPKFIEAHRLAPFKHRGTDVDVVLDLMIHDIDIILTLVASPLKSIQAVGVEVITNEVDIANARLEFVNGCIANITASRVSNKSMRKLRVFQPNSYISVDFGENKFTLMKCKHTGHLNHFDPDTISTEKHSFNDTDVLLEEIQAFVDSINSGSAPVVSGEEGKHALEVALNISEIIKNTPHSENADGIVNLGTPLTQPLGIQ